MAKKKKLIIIKRGKPDCDKEPNILDSEPDENRKCAWKTIKKLETKKSIILIQQFSVVSKNYIEPSYV